MSDTAPPPDHSAFLSGKALTVAIVLPPREGFGPRRARRIGLTVRDHALAVPDQRTIVFGGRQSGTVFPDMTFHHVHALSFLPGSVRWRYILGLVGPLRRLRPDLIEVHDDARLALALRGRFPATPVVLFLHNDPAAVSDMETPAARSVMLDRLTRIVTMSDWLRDRVLDQVPPPLRPPLVLKSCIDLARLPHTGGGDDPTSIALSKRRTRLLLFAGRLVPEKGADQFVAACAASLPYMPGWRAEIIGAAEHGVDSPESAFTQLLTAIARPVSIGMMGFRDHPDVMAAMARAAIVVIPTRVPDPTGRIALEAMANGAAVICSASGALPEIAGETAVYADPAQPAELAAAIRALAQNPGRLAELAESGRARAAGFDLPETGRQLRDIRAAVLAGV